MQFTLEKSTPPHITQLYNLQPIGIGTPVVESLTSYIVRLAEAHCVSTGTLISKVIIPELNKPYLNNLAENGGTRLYRRSHAINGVGKMAQTWTEVLQALTGCADDLKQLSWIRWSTLTPSRELLKQVRSWCPHCFDEQVKNRRPVYEPLIWSTKCITFCVLHDIELTDTCPKCWRQMPPLERKTLSGMCSKCNSWLGEHQNLIAPTINMAHSHSKFNQVGELLRSNEEVDPDPNVIVSTLTHFVDIVHSGNIANAARDLGMPKTTFWGWITGLNSPPLQAALRVAERLNINLIDLFSKNINSFSLTSKVGVSESYVSNVHNVSTELKRQLDFDAIKRYLELASQPHSPLQSLSHIAETLKIDKRSLREHFPNLCHSISERIRFSVAETSQARKELLGEAIRQATHQLHERNIYPSRRKVEAFLNMSGVLREREIKNSWHEALSSLGYTVDNSSYQFDKTSE